MAVLFCSFPMIRAAVRTRNADEAKSRHYLNSALAESSKDNSIIYTALFRRAVELDSTDEYIRFLLGQDAASPVLAEPLMRPYAEKHPEDRYVAMPFIGALVGAGETDEALRWMSRLVDARPEDLDVRKMELELWALLDSVERAEAVIDFMKEVGIDDDRELTLRLALLGRKEESIDSAKVIQLMRDYSIAHPEDSMAFSQYVFGVYSFSDPQEARDILAKRIQEQPDRAFNYNLLLSIGNYEQDTLAVREIVMKILDLPDVDPTDVTGFLLDGKNPAYNAIFDSVATRFPDNKAVQEQYFVYNCNMDRFGKADSLIMADRVEFTNPYVVACAVNTELAQDKPSEAMEIYRRAKEAGVSTEYSDPMLPAIYVLLNDEKNFTAYRDSVAGAILEGISPVDTLKPLPYSDILPNTEILVSLYNMESDLYHKLGDADKCLLASRNALTVDPDNAEVLNNYAYFIALSSDDPEDLSQAFSMVSKAVDTAADLNAFDTMAFILFKQGRVKEAIDLQEKTIGFMNPDSKMTGEFLSHLGDFYAVAGDVDKAVEMWEKALSLDSEDRLLNQKISTRTYIPEPFGKEE